MKLSAQFRDAAADYLHLLERGYSAGKILPLVSSRYQLSGVERTMLYRGVFTQQKKTARQKKLVTMPRAPLQIDGFNVLITIASYLQGLPVFLAGDGLVRDAAYVRGKIEMIATFERAAGLLLKSLHRIEGEQVIFLDQEVTLHNDIGQMLAGATSWDESKHRLAIIEKVDEALKLTDNGCICTSDSGIIDAANIPFFDLARYVLASNFNSDFFDMSEVFG